MKNRSNYPELLAFCPGRERNYLEKLFLEELDSGPCSKLQWLVTSWAAVNKETSHFGLLCADTFPGRLGFFFSFTQSGERREGGREGRERQTQTQTQTHTGAPQTSHTLL